MSINSSTLGRVAIGFSINVLASEEARLRQRIMALYRSGNDNGVDVARGEKLLRISNSLEIEYNAQTCLTRAMSGSQTALRRQ
jgi:hypothetical protein